MKKTYFAALVALATLLLTSCNFENQSQHTPRMAISPLTRTCLHGDSVVKDTLGYRYDKDGKGVLDTIHVGDTVVFSILLDAQGNMLTGFQTQWDSAVLHLEYLAMDSIRYALDTANCDIKGGKLQFLPGYNQALFPIRYIPRKAATATMEFEVQSDSKFSPISFTIQQTAE